MPNPKNQSGDPMWKVIYKDRGDLVLEAPHDSISKADINFEDTAKEIQNLVESSIRPAMKKMAGSYWTKIMDDLKRIEKLSDDIRREAGNLGI